MNLHLPFVDNCEHLRFVNNPAPAEMKHHLLLIIPLLSLVAVGCGKAANCIVGTKEYSQQDLRDIATNALASVSSTAALTNDCAVVVAWRQSGPSNHLLRATAEWAGTAELRPFAEKLPYFTEEVALPKDPAKDLPPYVWLRFGSHARYAWLLLFPSKPAPHSFLSTCEKLSDTVYLSNALPPL